jgi:hypothetical protein
MLPPLVLSYREASLGMNLHLSKPIYHASCHIASHPWACWGEGIFVQAGTACRVAEEDAVCMNAEEDAVCMNAVIQHLEVFVNAASPRVGDFVNKAITSRSTRGLL